MANDDWEEQNNPFSEKANLKETTEPNPVPRLPARRKAAPPIPTRAAAKEKEHVSATPATTSPPKPAKRHRAEGLSESAKLCYEENVFRKANFGASLPGEKDVLKGIESIYQDKRGRKMHGWVSMSNYKFSFKPARPSHIPEGFFHIPLGCIARIEKDDPRQPSKAQRMRAAMKSAMKSAASTVVTTTQNGKQAQMVLKIHCKDVRYLQFIFTGENAFARGTNIYRAVEAFAFPVKQTELSFATMSKEPALTADALTDKHSPHYNFHTEFTRLDILSNPTWRVTELNVTYEYAPTYPRFIVVPRNISDDDLRAVGNFRSKARVPAMSWAMPNKGPTLWRCSQPRVGLGDNRCAEDEKMLRSIMSSNPGQRRFFIGDARPRVNATANRMKGWGYETTEGYSFADLKFMDIENIHAMRSSLAKLTDLLTGAKAREGRWLAEVENTAWLYHGRCVLKGAITAAEMMFLHNKSVLVHCSDGWDRTAQLSGLVQVMLDPFARTKRGFLILVQKEWCSFGHQFQKRIGHANAKFDDNQRSPVFLQFLDCTYQLLAQYPQCFEFTSGFLVECADHLYSCRFGSFFADCERLRAKVLKNTPSLWDHLMREEFRKRFDNPLYMAEQGAILPSGAMCCRNVHLWADYFLRWSTIPSMPSCIFFDSTSPHPPPHVWPSSAQMVANARIFKHKQRAQAFEKLIADKDAEIEALKAELAATKESAQRNPNARSSKLMAELCANENESMEEMPSEEAAVSAVEPTETDEPKDTSSSVFDVNAEEDEEISSLAVREDGESVANASGAPANEDPRFAPTDAEDPLMGDDDETSDELL